ncbi:MAG: 2-phosphosulfolactate phosphatase family protein [Roseiflexaceae bacterium]
MLTIERAGPDTCHSVRGAAAVIDVIRAFTTAAYAFAAGASAIVPARTVAEAFAFQAAFPGALLMGEERGLMPPGFDFGNSPAALLGRDLGGRVVVQRTGMGTVALLACGAATPLLAGSFACAGATVRYLLRHAAGSIALVRSGIEPEGEEDDACADYLAELLRGSSPNPAPFLRRARESYAGRMFTDLLRPGFDPADLECCVALDRFGFALVAERPTGTEAGGAPLIIRAVPC